MYDIIEYLQKKYPYASITEMIDYTIVVAIRESDMRVAEWRSLTNTSIAKKIKNYEKWKLTHQFIFRK